MNPQLPAVAHPSDDWLLVLNFYLIVNSGGTLCLDNFGDERLAQAYQENPGQDFNSMDATATQLVLEFQAKAKETEVKITLQETSNNGAVPIPLLRMPESI